MFFSGLYKNKHISHQSYYPFSQPATKQITPALLMLFIWSLAIQKGIISSERCTPQDPDELRNTYQGPGVLLHEWFCL